MGVPHFWILIHFQRGDNFWMQRSGCHFGNETQILLCWFKAPTRKHLWREMLQSLPRNPGQVSYSVWISAPHLLKQGKCSCFSSRKVVVRISYPNPVLALLFYLVSACPVFFKHTLIMERKNMPSTIICCARGGQYGGEWYEDQDSPNSDCLFQL